MEREGAGDTNASDTNAPTSSATPPTTQDRCAPGITPLPAHIQRGMCLAHNYQSAGSRGYGSPTSRATLRELRELGVDWVSLTPFGFMERLDEARVHPIGGYRAGETDERIRREIAQAKAVGLHVVLKPHLWIVRGKWRGNITFGDPKTWQQWFDSYERWMLHYADLAQAEGIDILVIGVELRSTESKLEKRWRRLIQRVRTRFQGELTYSANWDDASAVPWWDALDYIGVQFYPPLSESPGADLASVGSVIEGRLDELESLSKHVNKSVLFTEVGYRSDEDALVRPHGWPERTAGARLDESAQALGYRAFVQAIRRRPWVSGVYWWKWFTDPDTVEEGRVGFSPRSKLAESIVRAAYDGNCGAPIDPP